MYVYEHGYRYGFLELRMEYIHSPVKSGDEWFQNERSVVPSFSRWREELVCTASENLNATTAYFYFFDFLLSVGTGSALTEPQDRI